MQSPLSKRQRLDTLEAQLRNERITFKSYWRDLSDYILPRRSRFFVSDANRGDRRNLKVIDSTATLASRTLSSGLMTGVTSPARKWFKLNTDDKELNDVPAVRSYLAEVGDIMRTTFLQSNLYNILPTLYGDLGTFGTGCIFQEEDMDDVTNFTSFLVGSYMIGTDSRGRVKVFFREFQMSVRQIVEKFGVIDPENPQKIDWSNISQSVKDQWDNHQHETQIDVSHFVLPNEGYRPQRIESKYKKYKSVYYEKGTSSTSNHNTASSASERDVFLSERGYDFFPVMAPRWEVAGEDVYGTNAPGMIALGDVKQLQLGEKNIARALDQKVKPSMVGPTTLKNRNSSILPGDITFIDESEGSAGFRRLFEIDFDIREMEQKQEQVRQRISRAYYEDLFLMLANSSRRQITAREVEERHEEKLLALGPVLERINQDLLDPLIENTFNILDKQGKLPHVPEELEGKDYSVEYVSVMAQAQKFAGIGLIERFIGFAGQAGQLDPQAMAKVNVDEAIQQYGDIIGIDSDLIKSKDELEALKQEQAAQQQAEQEAIEAQSMVDAGKTLSETKMNEDTALQQVLSGV